jgi:hypothetical protein
MTGRPEDLDPWDRALLDALEEGGDDARLVSLEDLATSSGISEPLLEMLAREGLLLARMDGDQPLFDPRDADTVKAGLALIQAGLPLAELMGLARDMDEVMRPMAERAVEIFSRYVRDSVEATASDDAEAAARLVDAFRSMLPATSSLVGGHFRRLLIEGAHRRLTDS